MEPLARERVGAELEMIDGDLDAVEKIIFEASSAKTSILTESATHLARAGGKRLRPAVVVLASALAGGPDRRVHLTAAAIEMTHLATLYHDDVIDEADLRRGVPSANEKWGNTVAILAGDYLFARASGIAADVGGRVPRVLADAIAEVVQGQVRELETAFDPGRSEEHYFTTIREKTASLIEASARLGGALADAPPEVEEALAGFGASFGLAFQIADDLLDLSAGREELGKRPGTDLRDGVYTLPVILAVRSEPSLAGMLGSPDADFEAVREVVVATGAFDEALSRAAEHVEAARSALKDTPDVPARAAIDGIARLVVERVPAL